MSRRADANIAITAAAAVLVLFVMSLFSVQQLHHTVGLLLPKNNSKSDQSLTSLSSRQQQQQQQQQQDAPKGVFVLKVMRAQHATQALCHLTHFFNVGPKYPVRIFADYDYTNETRQALDAVAGGANVQIIVDKVSWKRFPPTLNVTEIAQVVENCQHLDSAEKATCSKLNVGLGYVYMGYWRYSKMANEPSLESYDYFVSVDADAYLTKPMPDPFQLMANNNLTGIFNIEAYQTGSIAEGIQAAAEETFSLPERRNRFVDSTQYSYFDSQGQWTREGQEGNPSIWGCFYGGRLDFFRSRRFKAFAEKVAPYTYIYRTDEQPVIGAAWSLLGDKVWYLPKHGIDMGVYHHGWVDNSEVIRLDDDDDTANRTENSKPYRLHTLEQWGTFGDENYGKLVHLEEYIETLGYDENDDWRKCLKVCNKDCRWAPSGRLRG